MERLKKILMNHSFHLENGDNVKLFLKITLLPKEDNILRISVREGKNTTKTKKTTYQEKIEFLNEFSKMMKYLFPQIKFDDGYRRTTLYASIPGIKFNPKESKKRGRKKVNKFKVKLTCEEIEFMLENPDSRIVNLIRKKL